ncbi:sulfotransferase [Phytohabitans sp. ZYX-F-186]|uniref:Sulfotransferase n=1 Tax=Phytohabitans maris TaxID=3071409 RepID=A0ABU0ZTM3_9ACTN|nr:sulfotransferase domain-containing protein [Phytohabitans sp. ZYX-F-186]MDQ7910394.1 sulfotransferase [Phytohabitans sp. ZYX-F-186]
MNGVPGRAIIISTGRCGSTLLSDLLHEDSGTLSVQEFFMTAALLAPDDDVLSGADYWTLLSSPKPDLSTLFRIGMPPKEVHYPSDGRWGGDLTRLPWILAITLSKLTPDPDRLFDALAEHVPAFPRQRVSRHHESFLDLLSTLGRKRRWVERSGGSSYVAPYLLRHYRDAKVVYLTRNWEDTAQSMSRHPSFQLIQLRVESLGAHGLDPFRVTPDTAVPEALERYLPDRLTADTLRERGRDVRRYLGLCAFMTAQAEQALGDARLEHLLTMRYEDLVEAPVAELTRLGRFLDLEDPDGWAARVAGRVGVPVRA